MKAVVFRGAFDVQVESVEEPKIEAPLDAIVRITTANICGSDLHPYEGRAPMESGMTLGHENMGIVEEVGPGVERIRVGDRVSVPFNIACGTCRNCNEGYTSACLRANPSGMPGAGYGYPNMGPYQGGQAEYLRVPWADFNLLELPQGTEHEADFTMLSDIFPTGYHGTELAHVRPGSSVVIFGAGPVGLMAAHSAALRGAARVFVVDKERDRLDLAEQYGATTIDFSTTSVEDAIMDATDGNGVDCGVEAVGYQAHDASGQEHPELVLDELVKVVRATGAIGVVGVYVSEDPDAAEEGAKEGRYGFNFGAAFEKGLKIGTGQCPVKQYNRELRDLIIQGKANPSRIVSHEVSLDEAPNAYDQFDKRVDGWTKVLLHPAAA
ncbi:glutathione-independent formaldehyde dehydrogenase [Agromyces aerolatus]|uniref:glutathione-independent formaldehyde dehydrogenase n=1 Tax=Agromyces sp. LY-1074 TaxID=3074080 RepID=UPI0028663473|nr:MULTISPECIES: glutathione-independent formaldehyde dehydrogenase [unclassified Agromyces]MDR5698567.1 glutathione-independent formaldehyde dehydrogenase [Agromyces sp. LY-1074]MDR5704861.1 glutathione-independent formaldehyde dehydrogenase [Agromyces sp. LY-1358]